MQAATRTLAGLAERHPSRTLLLIPDPDSKRDALDAEVSLQCFALPGAERHVCSEVVELRLRGGRAEHPASIVQPLLISDLPVFLRWRGRPSFGSGELDELLTVADRLVVDSVEWEDVPEAYAEVEPLFERTAVSDIAFRRTQRWRRELAELWPDIADVLRLEINGPRAEAALVAGWLRSRLRREIELVHEDAKKIARVVVDAAEVRKPPGDDPSPSDLLSAELDCFSRDRVYEDAVRAAA